jgi:hypothetical protein
MSVYFSVVLSVAFALSLSLSLSFVTSLSRRLSCKLACTRLYPAFYFFARRGTFADVEALGERSALGQRHVGAALQHIWATEGVPGLYRGITLNLVKNPLAIGVSFLVNDLVKEVRAALSPHLTNLSIFSVEKS